MNRKILLILAVIALVLLAVSSLAQSAECELDVYGAEVEGNVISGYVKNTGIAPQAVSYTVNVNGGTVSEGGVTLDPDEEYRVEHYHSFLPGSHYVKLEASSECGAHDYDSETHLVLESYSCTNPYGLEGENRCDYSSQRYLVCQDGCWLTLAQNTADYCFNCGTGICGDGIVNCGETVQSCPEDYTCERGYLDNYKCDGDWLQREYQYEDCSTKWKDYERCRYGCSSGECESRDKECRLRMDYDYESYVNEDSDIVYVFTIEVRNTGESRELVELDVYLDGEHEEEFSFELKEDGYREETVYLYDLEDSEEYGIELRAEAECGYSVVEFMVIEVPEELSFYDYVRKICGVQIESFDYTGYVFEGSKATVTFSVKNTGNIGESIRTDFYLDSVRKGTQSSYVTSGQSYSSSFSYYPTAGQHDIELVSKANCGSEDTRSGLINVQGRVALTPVYPEPAPEPAPGPRETYAGIYPDTMDVELYKAKVVSLNLETSKPQTFRISAGGLPEGWVSHEEKVYVEGQEFSYIYVTPDTTGKYTLKVEVLAESQNLRFAKDIEVFVAPHAEGAEAGFAPDFITGLFLFITGNALAIFLVILVFGSIIFIGWRRGRQEELV